MYTTILIALFFLGLQFYSAFSFPLSGEEAYYWTWSQSISWGYWHHPPMIAYGLGIATTLFSKTELAVRGLGIILHIFSSYLLANKTKSPTQTLLFLLTLPGLAVIGFEAHPQLYFASFFTLALWAWLSKRWILMGLFCCFCFLSTTSGFFFIPFLILMLFLSPEHRKGIGIAIFISILGCIPWALWLLTLQKSPMGLFYNLSSSSLIISGLDLFFYVGCSIFASLLIPKTQEQKILWSISVFLLLSITLISPQFMGIGWGVAGIFYICHRFPNQLVSIILGLHMFMFGVQKLNLHIPLLPSDVHVAQKYNGGEILADVVHAWGVEDIWTASPFDAAWIRFYSDRQAHTNKDLGTESQFDLWNKPFPDSGLMIQENSRVFSIPSYTFSNIQTIASYADSYKEGAFVQTHQWNTALFQRDEASSPSKDAD